MLQEHREPEVTAPPAPFAVRYVPQSALPGFMARAGQLLGVVGFGAGRPELLPPDCPFLTAPLAPLDEPVFEIWTAPAPVQPLCLGGVTGASSGAVSFGAVTLEADVPTEAAAERAYQAIFDFLDRAGHVPIRIWNYPVAITADEGGMERYRHFNIGRHRAFTARLRQARPPAATGVGGHHGASVIYFLAAREPAVPVENPRQVSAFDYPPVYGPRSPSFSRASAFTLGGRSCLFISGTASIVGHESLHIGDLAGQIGETAENLRAVAAAAKAAATGVLRGPWALKIYLHDAAARPLVIRAVDAVFGPDAECILLRGDICRRELLVEIEAFRQF